MTDTPLHLHPAVVWLMQQPEWPRDSWGNVLTMREDHLHWEWRTQAGESIDGVVCDRVVESLIELAAVRALWRDGWHCFWTGEELALICETGKTERKWFDAPTELLAILAALQGTCIQA